jgi:hypothetical protein
MLLESLAWAMGLPLSEDLLLRSHVPAHSTRANLLPSRPAEHVQDCARRIELLNKNTVCPRFYPHFAPILPKFPFYVRTRRGALL